MRSTNHHFHTPFALVLGVYGLLFYHKSELLKEDVVILFMLWKYEINYS